jgi:archaellum component FlaF (FlaF/FlaG flagellin family)
VVCVIFYRTVFSWATKAVIIIISNMTFFTFYSTLLEMHTKITKQRDEFYVELETMKRSSTPRFVIFIFEL